MTIVILGATGGTGRKLVAGALAAGHDVRALVRNPATANFPPDHNLDVVQADVHQPSTITSAISRGDFVLSGLGVPSKAEVGILTAGAAAVSAARPDRMVWLGATGTGVSAPTINRGVAWLLRSGFGAEYDDKTKSEKIIADAGGIVVHSGPLTDKEDDPLAILRPLDQVTRRFFPYGAPRASVARLMLTLAGNPHPPGGIFLIQRA